MTDLQKQAEEYAKDALKRYNNITIWKVDVFRLIAEAYEQGWVDCDTKDDKPETLAELLNEAPDCRYFSEGYCNKGLAGTFCEREGCAAYCPKEYAENAQKTRK